MLPCDVTTRPFSHALYLSMQVRKSVTQDDFEIGSVALVIDVTAQPVAVGASQLSQSPINVAPVQLTQTRQMEVAVSLLPITVSKAGGLDCWQQILCDLRRMSV
jgi:hypothetical protein